MEATTGNEDRKVTKSQGLSGNPEQGFERGKKVPEQLRLWTGLRTPGCGWPFWSTWIKSQAGPEQTLPTITLQ